MTWEIGSELAWSLGKFKPSSLDNIHAEMCKFLFKRLPHCAPSLHVRDPDHDWSMRHTHSLKDEALHWHQDNRGDDGKPFNNDYLGVWANMLGTHFLTPDGWEFRAEPYEVVLFNNCRMKHKAPMISRDGRRGYYRHFVRFEVKPDYPIRNARRFVWGEQSDE